LSNTTLRHSILQLKTPGTILSMQLVV